VEYGARSSASFHLLHYLLFTLEGNCEAMEVKSVEFAEISAKLEVIQTHEALSVIVGKKLQIDVDIFDDREVRLILVVFILVFLKVFNVVVYLVAVFSRGQKEKGFVEGVRLESFFLYRLVILYPPGCSPHLRILKKFMLFLLEPHT